METFLQHRLAAFSLLSLAVLLGILVFAFKTVIVLWEINQNTPTLCTVDNGNHIVFSYCK